MRPYSPSTRQARSAERVLDAADALVRERAFHLATVEELARRARVSRATVFSRFGSKLGVLEALSVRCEGGPEMLALRSALALPDAARALDATIAACCELWENQGAILEQLQAIVVLEPGASALIAAQHDDQRQALAHLTARLARAPGLRRGLTKQRVTATLHMLTSLESYRELRRDAAQSPGQARDTVTALAHTLLRPAPRERVDSSRA
jgi:AcrR family transcriptional regulator